MNREKLAKELREVAEAYFNGDKDLQTTLGICAALAEKRATLEEIAWSAYRQMEKLLKDLGEPMRLSPYSRNREDWEPRAWMCLFLAEYLENT